MTGLSDARYRLRLARGFLAEARQDLALKRWRSAVDNAQLSVENSAKAVLALAGSTGKTHSTGELLREALDYGVFAGKVCEEVELLVQYAELTTAMRLRGKPPESFSMRMTPVRRLRSPKDPFKSPMPF